MQRVIPGLHINGQQIEQELVVLSFGMGVESATILMRWLKDPSSRPFELHRLVVITAMTGDEHASTARVVTQHLLPLLRLHGVRFIQVARAGRLKKDGYTVLDDSRMPTTLHIGGAWKLSQELLSSGTVPQFASGQRRCSIKFKGDILDAAKRELLTDSYMEVIGFNAGELRRVERDKGYGAGARHVVYPLVEWGWTRDVCEAYLRAQTGEDWPKSACTYCPFAGGKEAALLRMSHEPEAAFQALQLEHVAMALNPRSTLYANGSLRSFLESRTPALVAAYDERVAGQQWAVYRVRRYYKKKGKAMRAVEKLFTGTKETALGYHYVAAERCSNTHTVGGIPYAYVHTRGDSYPAVEEFLAACPATVADKKRAGFEKGWAQALAASQSQAVLPLAA